MKQLLALSVVILLYTSTAFSQGGPNATMGASSSAAGPMAGAMNDNEALRRILYGIQHPIPSSVTITSVPGAVNVANGQVTSSTTAGTLVIARPTRRSCLIKNTDPTLTVYVGKATVTSGNGMPLLAGQSVVINDQALVQVIAASGTPIVAYLDEYD
jgi:hypothetical protein